MSVRIPEPEDTEMNMTPMIDIVFQLIIFFLLSLKFKSVEQRIQSELPKDRGIQATSQFVEELPMLTVKLFRRDMETPEKAFTRIRVGNAYTFELPRGEWQGTFEADDARQLEYDKVKADVMAAVRAMWSQMQNNPDVKGEIKTPPPFGQGVPHGDVIMVLDAFLEAGIKDVKFEGAMPPNFTPGQGGIIESN